MKNIIKHIKEDKDYLRELVFRLNLYNRAHKLPPHELKETIVSLSNALNTLSNYLYKAEIEIDAHKKMEEVIKFKTNIPDGHFEKDKVKPTNNFEVIKRLN